MRRGLDTCRTTNLAAALMREDVKHTEEHNSSRNIRQRIYLVVSKQKKIIIAQDRVTDESEKQLLIVSLRYVCRTKKEQHDDGT